MNKNKLVLFVMLFGVMVVTTDSAITDRASAQNACSKEVDGRKINFDVVNKSDKPFVVQWVDHSCKEKPPSGQIAPGGTTKIFGIHGHVYRVREVGTNRLLQEIVANPGNPAQIIIGAGAANNVKNNAPAANQPPSAPASQQSNAVMATKLPLTAGSALKKGVKYFSPSGNHYLSLQNDGNLVLKTKDEGFVWGLNQVARNYAQSDRVELGRDGGFGVYDAKGGTVWAPQAKRDPSARLNITFNGALQLVAGNGEILWSTDGNLAPSINVFTTKANAKSCAAEPGWAKCLELPEPTIKIMGSAAASQSAMNAVANIYTEITKRFAAKYPKDKFNGFKVYLTNGEPWSVLSKMSPVGTMWKDQTGPMSGNFLRGGASENFLWISEQMICKQGVKTRNADGTPDNDIRTLDQVVHEFAHSIDYKYIPDQTVNGNFRDGGSPVERFAFRVQNWFGAPSGTMPPNQEAVLKDLFTSRATFSCEGYRP